MLPATGFGWVVMVTLWAAFGFICAYMAGNRGRDKNLGFLGGFTLGFIPVFYYWMVGDTPELREAKARHAADILADAIVRAQKKDMQ